ncbi:hypothetical protein BO71DRAFT_281153, partial [Aspergillus ellipticus CBS 707.79]
MSLPKHTSPPPLSSSPPRPSVRRTSVPSRPRSIIDRPATAQQVTVTDIPEHPHDTTTPPPPPSHDHSQEPDQQPSFQPFFTLIQDAHSTEYHHPTIHYIFSDDDTDIITEAALRTLESEPDSFPKSTKTPRHDPSPPPGNNNPSTYHEEGEGDEYPPHRKESLLPDPIPGVRDNYIILDVEYASPDSSPEAVIAGLPEATNPEAHADPIAQQPQQQHFAPAPTPKYTVASAHSLSPSWQVLNTELVPAPTFENTNSFGGGSGAGRGQAPNGGVMLKIQGTAGLPMRHVPGKEKDRDRISSGQRLEEMMDQFAKRLGELRLVIEGGE